jgi:hypothetical protein
LTGGKVRTKMLVCHRIAKNFSIKFFDSNFCFKAGTF